jgi:hypothetical protein
MQTFYFVIEYLQNILDNRLKDLAWEILKQENLFKSYFTKEYLL